MGLVYEQNASDRTFFYWLLAGGVVLMGIGMAWFLYDPYAQAPVEIDERKILIESIEVGSLVDKADPKALNPAMKPQSQFFSTTDQIVLRVTTTEQVTEPYELFARLITKEGKFVDLDPPSATFLPGESSFCCWQIEEPGEYQLQIFRPEKITTSIPIRVIGASARPSAAPGGLPVN